jgi:D-glycero-D-manno-heptose 1,7-bisphosphate phosphatase
MLVRLVEAWSVERSASFLVGDKATDVGAAEAAGIRGFRYLDGPVDAFVASCRAAIASAAPRPETGTAA